MKINFFAPNSTPNRKTTRNSKVPVPKANLLNYSRRVSFKHNAANGCSQAIFLRTLPATNFSATYDVYCKFCAKSQATLFENVRAPRPGSRFSPSQYSKSPLSMQNLICQWKKSIHLTAQSFSKVNIQSINLAVRNLPIQQLSLALQRTPPLHLPWFYVFPIPCHCPFNLWLTLAFPLLSLGPFWSFQECKSYQKSRKSTLVPSWSLYALETGTNSQYCGAEPIFL